MPVIRNGEIGIYYEVVGQGPPLVMIHGGFMSIKTFHDYGYIDNLKDTYQLILVDLRGFGQSDKPNLPEKYSLRIHVEDVISVLDELGIKTCHAMGYSLGGWIVHGLSIYYPERLKSIILIDGFPGSGDAKMSQSIADNFPEIVLKWKLPPLLEKHLLNNDQNALKAIAGWQGEELTSIIRHIESGIEKIQVPTLIFLSKHEKESDEYRMAIKCEEEISVVKLIHHHEFGHLELFTNSQSLLPQISEFLNSI